MLMCISYNFRIIKQRYQPQAALVSYKLMNPITDLINLSFIRVPNLRILVKASIRANVKIMMANSTVTLK